VETGIAPDALMDDSDMLAAIIWVLNERAEKAAHEAKKR
jgi:hypothetical protein